MTKRNRTTTVMVVAATLLLYGGVTLAQNAPSASRGTDNVAASRAPSPSAMADDPTGSIEPGDDNGQDASAVPSFDDHGNGADEFCSPERCRVLRRSRWRRRTWCRRHPEPQRSGCVVR